MVSDIGSEKFVSQDIFKQISALDEFKKEDKRIDSINKFSEIPIKLAVQIIDNSFFPEDKGKNIAVGFINNNFPLII